jgi:hypothetical protein
LAFGHLILLNFRFIIGGAAASPPSYSARTKLCATNAGEPAGSRCQVEAFDARCRRWLAFTIMLKPNVFAVTKFADADEITSDDVKVEVGRHAVLLSLGPGHQGPEAAAP